VQRVDSLSKIASEFNTDVNTIKNVNNLSSNIIQIGQQLLIPTDVIDYEPVIDGYQEYIVQRGDSLSKIATIFNTDINTIKTLNNLTSNTILIGQVLKVPNGVDDSSNDLTYTEYIVSRGDSLWKIAKDFNTTVNEIMELNGLTSANLQIGDVLKIPNRNNYNSGNNDDFSVNNYTVQRGDSLWSIAKNFNTTVDEIKNANGLSSNLLSVGQVLIIP
jgi:D-gamma-glutamyl-meso-diaminopimelic acid endopeptidase CwlS/peptidoglycan endopeptidase LytF/peptidoglycan endopeptidase LytE